MLRAMIGCLAVLSTFAAETSRVRAQKDSAVSPVNSTIVARLQLELAQGITAVKDAKTKCSITCFAIRGKLK